MLDKISEKLIKPIHILVFLIMIVMVVLVSIQIFFRFVLNVSVPWTEEMARLCFVWMIFLGSAVVEAEGGQVTTSIFVEKLGAVPRFILGTIIYVIEILFNIALFIGSILSWNTVKMMTFSTVPVWDYRLLYVPLLIAVPYMVFYLVIQNVRFYYSLFPAKGGEDF